MIAAKQMLTRNKMMIAVGHVLYATEFVAAKKYCRFPSSNRPSSIAKRINYFARAMAGISARNHRGWMIPTIVPKRNVSFV